jgi:hypothetical protein
MSAQQLTYESVLELIRESSREGSREIQEMRRLMKERDAEFDRRIQEADLRTAEIREQMQETDLRIKRTNEEVGNITGSMGRVIEHMVAGDNIIGKFKNLGYNIGDYSRNKKFGRDLPEELGAKGEIDLFLENGDIAILIEVKTTLQTKDVHKLMRTLERFRRCADYKGDKRRFVGAIAGAVVEEGAMELAHENGLYTIVQSGEAVEIVPVPEGFKAREW